MSKYEIRLMQKSDSDQVFTLLKTSFFHDEPICRAVQLKSSDDFASNLIDSCLNNVCSFVAFDIQNNRIVAFAINEIVNRTGNEETNVTDEKLRFILKVIAQVHQPEKIFDRMNSDRLLHIFMITVDEEARGHNLASKLIAASVAYGKQLQLGGAYAEVTNTFSLHCFEQNSFEILNELKYAEGWPEQLSSMTDPHYDRCYLVVRKFN